MFGVDKGILSVNDHSIDGKKLYIGIVQARLNEGVTNALVEACKAELLALDVTAKHIKHYSVPSAMELPVALQALAEKNEFDALIAIACIIRDETYHFELVANESAAGITRVALDYKLPIANAILAVENTAQAQARQTINGIEAARVAVEMANLLNTLS
jgi:6,7-dimethyl-8-ribityllumazine synthase